MFANYTGVVHRQEEGQSLCALPLFGCYQESELFFTPDVPCIFLCEGFITVHSLVAIDGQTFCNHLGG